MASMFRASTTNHNGGGGDGSGGGGGGKIMRGRRTLDASSPYSRPQASTSENPNPNPNRLVRLISPVISGAAKIISTVFFPGSSPTSSSSSSEYDSEKEDDISSEGDDSLNQNAETSEANAYFEKNLQFNVAQNEIKPAIERLLMQETFSRDECNKLVKIIESRVVEFPANSAKKVGGDTGRHQGGHGTDNSNTAVLEAKRWVEENNWGSPSQLDKSRGNLTPHPSNFIRGELGSPVLMAKSYMESRPQWTSPTAANSEYQTVSPIGLYVSKEETPHATMANDLSLSKDLKRGISVDTPDSLEGLRRVRFKIAENKARPLAACDNLEENSNVKAAKRDATLSSDALPTRGFVKKSAHLSVDSPKNNGCSASQGSGHLASPLLNNHNQDLDAGQIKQERSTNHNAADLVLETQDDSRWQDDYPKQKETNSDRFGTNGSASAQSLSARVNTRSSPRADNEGLNAMTTSSNWEGSYELLSEFSIEVPRDEETNDATEPANDPNKQSREQIVTETTSVSNPGMKRRSSSAKVEKHVTKTTTKPPSRRGRGRGRGRGK